MSSRKNDSDSRLPAVAEEGISEDRAKLLLERHKTDCREDGPLAELRAEFAVVKAEVASNTVAMAALGATVKTWGKAVALSFTALALAVSAFTLFESMHKTADVRAIPAAQAATK